MSLIAHYKLDGNAEDNIGNNHGTIYGSPTTAAGKLGDCLDFDGTNDYIGVNIENPPNTQSSFSLWVKPDIHSSQAIITQRADPPGNHSRGLLVRDTGFEFFSRNSGGTWQAISYSTSATNKFSHLVGVQNGSMIYLYVDGELRNSMDMGSNLSNYLEYFEIGDYTNATYRTNGKIDDVRIYDHALSIREVKELAKAKILHYKFDNFVEPTENLWGNQDGTPTSLNPAGTTPPTAELIDYPMNPFGNKAWKVIIPANCDTGYHGCRVQTNSTTINFDNTKYSYFTYITGNTGGITIYPTGSRGMSSLIRNSEKDESYWEYYEREGWSYDGGGTTGNEYLVFYANASTTSTRTFYISCIQIENKDHATPFVNGTRTDNTITDSSGQGNDGIVELPTTPEWTDGIIGKGAYNFWKDKTYIVSNIITPAGDPEVTVSIWARSDITSQDPWTGVIGLKSGQTTNQSFTINYDGTTNNMTLHTWGNSTSGFTLDTKWHHYVAVNTGNSNQLFYVDGVLIGELNEPLSLPNGRLTIGIREYILARNDYWERTWDGQVDDARVYATALSVDEIKELYQQRASLDSQGDLNIHELGKSSGIRWAWSQFGGTQYASFGSNLSDDALHASTANNIVSSYEDSGTMNSTKDMYNYDTAINMDGVTWVKQINIYDSNGDPASAFYSHSDGIGGGFQMPCTVKLVLPTGVTMKDILNGVNGQKLSGQVEMYIDDIYYGKTDTLAISSTSIGFANPSDPNGQTSDNLMYGWGARHVVSYNRTTSGRDAIRCQFICWNGSEDIVEEILWGLKSNEY